MDNHIKGLINPGAGVILSLHSMDFNPGEVIPGLEHVILIFITSHFFY